MREKPIHKGKHKSRRLQQSRYIFQEILTLLQNSGKSRSEHHSNIHTSLQVHRDYLKSTHSFISNPKR